MEKKKRKKAGPEVRLLAKLFTTVAPNTIDKALRASGGSAQTTAEKIYASMDDYVSPELEDALPDDGIRMTCGNCAATYVTMSANPLCLNCRKKRYVCSITGISYLSFKHITGEVRKCLDCYFVAPAESGTVVDSSGGSKKLGAEQAPRKRPDAASNESVGSAAAGTVTAEGTAPAHNPAAQGLPPGVDPEDPDWLTWEAFDNDDSGCISVQELHEFFTEGGIILDAAQIARVNAVADLNGSGRISFTEFKELLQRVRADGVESLLMGQQEQQPPAQPAPEQKPAQAAAVAPPVATAPPPPPQPQQQQQAEPPAPPSAGGVPLFRVTDGHAQNTATAAASNAAPILSLTFNPNMVHYVLF